MQSITSLSLPLDTFPFPVGSKLVHKKSGGHYRLLAYGRIEATLEPCATYSSIPPEGSEDPVLTWVRPLSEMFDGRFVVAPENPDA